MSGARSRPGGSPAVRRPGRSPHLSERAACEVRVTRSFCFLNEIGADAPLIPANEVIMSAPVIRGLAATIRGAVTDLTRLATDAAAELAHEVEGFKSDVEDVRTVTKDVRAARAEVRAALGQGTNGAPPLDDPTPAPEPAPSSAASHASQAPQSNSPVTMQRSPIGFVPRRT